MNPILVYVDNKPVYVPINSTVIQACDKVNVVIPRFCYHDHLEIAGNCRICLVEIEKSPKPMASCGLPVLDQIRIYTNTPLVKKAREGVIEFLLLNHPLDCPICDQGGECDLQNQARNYGNNLSRFFFAKRGVEDKNLGVLITTIITRCIHCTRCIRFSADVAGIEDLGTTLRGINTEVTTYVEKVFDSEVSINIVDLCPVGALTSSTYAFKARPWEVKSTKAIDISDSLGSNIVIETKRNTLLRVLPRTNLKINKEWLSDAGRYTPEGYLYIRLIAPYYIKDKKFNKFLNTVNIVKILQFEILTAKTIKVVVGRNLDFASLYKTKYFGRKLGIDLESETALNFPLTYISFAISNKSLDKIKGSNESFLLGVNPRQEATIANLHLRHNLLKNNIKVNNFGCNSNLTYTCKSYGLNFQSFLKAFKGQNIFSLKTYKRALLVYGDSLTQRFDGISNILLTSNYLKNISTENLDLMRFASGSNASGKAFFNYSKNLDFTKTEKLIYALGIENNQTLAKLNNLILKQKKSKIIYENTHPKFYENKADYLLPIQSYLERTSYYANHSGNIQESNFVLRFNYGFEPFNIVQNLVLNNKNKYNLQVIKSNLVFLKIRSYKKMSFNFTFSNTILELSHKFKNFKIIALPYLANVGNIYTTHNTVRTSLTLIKVSSYQIKNYWSFL